MKLNARGEFCLKRRTPGFIIAWILIQSVAVTAPDQGTISKGGPGGNPRTWIVDQNGKGDFITIMAAVDEAGSGDFIQVNPGIYSESVKIDKPLTMTAIGGPAGTIIFPPPIDIVGSAIEITMTAQADSSSPSLITGVTPNTLVTIEGFTVSAPQFGMYIKRGSHALIRNCIAVFCNGGGYLIESSSTVDISNVVATLNGQFGLMIDNEIEDILGNIRNSIFYDNGTTDIMRIRKTANTSPGGLQVNGRQPDFIYNDYLTNNGVAIGLGNIMADPLFVDPSQIDFHLTSNSPCIDSGRFFEFDPDGTRVDMGAFAGPASINIYIPPAGGPIITNLRVFGVDSGSKVINQGDVIRIEGTAQIGDQ